MSRFTRGIFGQKPTAAGASDIIGLDTQYAATVSGTWPSTTSSTGFVAAENFSGDCGTLSYSKHADGLYYPGLFVESAPYSSYTNFGSLGGYGPISVSKGGAYLALIVTTVNSPTSYDIIVWKKVTYGNTWIWRYLTALTSGTSSTKYPSCVAFHPSGNYIVYGIGPAQTFAGVDQLVALSRSGDTFTALTTPPQPSTSSACVVTAVEWNPQGTSLAVSISVSPYLVIYNFSNGVFTKLSAPATLPAAVTSSLAWNPSGTSLAYQNSSMRIYNRSGDTFTSISGLPAGFAGQGYAGSMSWNNDGTLLAIASTSDTNGVAAVWSRSGDSFSALSIPGPMTGANQYKQAQFNPNGKELLMTQSLGIDIWDVNGTTISRRATSPFGAYGGKATSTSGTLYGAMMDTTYGGANTRTVFTPTDWVRWIPPA